MASTTLAEGRTFLRAGKSVSSLYLITEGSVSAFRQGSEITLNTGDVVGACELNSPAHFFSYKTLEKSTLETYSFSDPEDLSALLCQDVSFTRRCLLSAFYQTQSLLEQYDAALDETTAVYQTCTEIEEDYLALCQKYRISPCRLPGLNLLAPFVPKKQAGEGLLEYLKGFQRFLNSAPSLFLKEPEVLTGLLYKNAADAEAAVSLSDEAADYLHPLYTLYAAADGPDFLGLYASLLFEIGAYSEDASRIQKNIARMLLQLENSLYPNHEAVHRKAAEYRKLLVASLKKKADTGNEDVDLTDSLSVILNFSTIDLEHKTRFRQKLNAYGLLKDRSSTDEESALLRKELTALFLELYQDVVLRSLDCKELPPAVLLFLHFGFVDETLAGEDYTKQLLAYSRQLSETRCEGIYTLYRWLMAVYDEEKEPSRNPFDEDYTDFLHTQKMTGKITEEEEKQLLHDKKQKLLFELNNMFPSVNKMTYGRITTYCPVFSDHNIFKPLDSSFVTPDAIYKIFEFTKKTDFQAFYRETIYTGEDCGISKEYIHTEYLPDIILMPCVGTRGVMWQEIEGKKRSTPARMMLPIFQMEDLTACLLHMFGEYRWEMCKREQGARWNDVTERSLTSEYFDYLQFYKKNPDFTPDAKEKIKSSLQKCKNNFKEMFVRDYVTWVLYESAGSPRLNKTARSILFAYCPFSASVRNELLNNPLFKESIERYTLKNKQKLHRMDNLFAKIRNSGHTVAPELEKEYEFLKL